MMSPGDDTASLLALVILLTMPMVFPLLNTKVRRTLVTWWARYRLNRLIQKQVKNSHGPTVNGIYVYPVKSMRAISLHQAQLDALGFAGDRRFMLVAPCPPRLNGSFHYMKKSHRFVTQRQCPSLATIEAKEKSSKLTLKCGKESIVIDVSSAALKDNPIFHAGIWDDVVRVVDLGDRAADFVQSIVDKDENSTISMDVRLVSLVEAKRVDDRYVPAAARTLTGETPQTSLNDGFPLLIACEASLQEVNKRLEAKGKPTIPMSRFRPNIVIRNTQAFEEDTWKAIQIGDTVMHIVKGCPRCKQSCTDQLTGRVNEEPLATLAEFRALSRRKEDVYFAQNAVAQSVGTTISLGDTVSVLTTGDPVWDLEKVKAE